MNKLTLINPKSPFLIDDTVFPPLGLLYLAEDDTIVIDLAVSNGIPKSEVYGITATTPQINSARKIARDLSGRKVLGGAHVSAVMELPGEFDAGVVGASSRGRVIRLPDGISQGFWEATKPNRDVIDLHRYHYQIDDRPATTMMTSFGCPYRCAFCSKPVWGQDIIYQPYSILEQEINDIQRLGFSAVMIFDDNFVLHPKFEKITQLLKDKDIIYRCFTNSINIDEEIIEWLSMTGCKEVGLGIESGSDKILRIINKISTVGTNLKAIMMLQDYMIKVKGFIIVGLPGEDEGTLQETDEFLGKAELDDVDITTFVPYPASPIWERKKQYDISWDYGALWDAYWYKGIPGQYQSVVRTKSLSEEQISDARQGFEDKYKVWRKDG